MGSQVGVGLPPPALLCFLFALKSSDEWESDAKIQKGTQSTERLCKHPKVKIGVEAQE